MHLRTQLDRNGILDQFRMDQFWMMVFWMPTKEHFVTKKLTSAATAIMVRIATNLFAVNSIRVTMVFAKMSKSLATSGSREQKIFQGRLSIWDLLRLRHIWLYWWTLRHRVSQWSLRFKPFREIVTNFSQVWFNRGSHIWLSSLVSGQFWIDLKECVCDPGLHGPRCNSKCDDTNCKHGGCVDRCVHYDDLGRLHFGS